MGAHHPLWVRMVRRARSSGWVGPPLHAMENVIGPVDRAYEHELTTGFVGLDELARHCPPSDETPTFVLGAGWRSGTTALQRLLMSGDSTLIWGEPWNRSQPTRSLAEQGRALSHEWLDILPTLSATDGDLDRRWIANLFPPIEDLLGAQQGYLLRLLRDPARDAGYTNWGFKEVRLGGEDLRYLTLLFPKAKSLIIHRDPRDAWASYRALGLRSYRRWPDHRVDTVHRFARNWKELASTLCDAASSVNALVIRYDDLRDDETLDAISAHVGISIDPDVADARVGGARGIPRLDRHELRSIHRIAGPEMERLGYG